MSLHLTRRTTLLSSLAGLAALASGPAFAGEPPVFQKNGVAASGYDVVAYFTEAKPVDGSDAFTASHEGATWRFASAENRETFLADPAKYAPQYGGYCAYAAAKGSTAPTVPEAWKVVDGKLYLNYSSGVQRRWESRQAGYIADADANWPQILN